MAKKYWIYKGEKIPVKKYRPKTEKNNEKLYRELVRKIGQANSRLSKIRSEFGGDIGWAGSILKNRTEFNLVNTWRGSKGIKASKSLSEEQMKATIIAINKFLNSQTSSVKGIKKVMTKQQQLLRQKFSSPNKELTVEESKTLYSLYDDPDFKDLTNNIGGSAEDIFSLLVEAKEDSWSKNKFIKELRTIMNRTPDKNMKKKISAIFNKWM